MYLEELTINGFKSFARKSELEFTAPITAIVGPNGSGKSNVAEAFRFVLGEQSVKSMRGKRGEDLIWGGTDKVSRGNRAAVQVKLNNRERVFPLDFDEIIVERIVHRDGQNEYSINGSKVRLKDVQEVLAVANIGSTGHHIISQGEADRILSASAAERREMIEDALGLKVYQYKKKDAEKKLEKTRTNIEQVQSLRREVAPHLKYLERQVKKLEKALELKEQLKTVYAEYLKREDTYIALNHDRLTAARQQPASKLEAVKESLAAAKETLRANTSSKHNDALLNAEEQLQKVRQQRQSVVKEVSQLEGKISFLQQRIERVLNRPKEAMPQVVDYKELSAVIDQIEREVQKAQQRDEVEYLQRALADVVHTLHVFLKKRQQTDEPLPGIEDDKAELVALEKQHTATKEQLQALETAEVQVQEQYDQVKARMEAEATDEREAERAVFQLVGEQREAEAALERIDRELSVLERDRAEFKRELQEAVALIGSGASQYYGFTVLNDAGEEVSVEALANEDRALQHERRRELEKMKIRLEELGIGADEDVVKEYQQAKERDEFLVREIADLESSVEKLESLIADLTEQLHGQFVAGVDKIAAEFNTFFVLMFGGGEAGLTLVKPKPKKQTEDEIDAAIDDEETDFEDGVELSVKLPNKRVKGLEMLSGGERALTSIALIFAMSQVNPPLFIILDETDAALDEANSRRYGDMIEALAKKSQLILITHNRETMSRAGILYGVTMGADGVSKLLSVKFDEAIAVAK